MKQIGIDVQKEQEEEVEDDIWKDTYYKEKFQIPVTDPKYHAFHQSLRQIYLEGLVWVMNYYHNGCISWGWYYPFYYAPLASGKNEPILINC